MLEKAQLRVEDDVAHVKLDDGKVNVMSVEMLEAIDAALTAAEPKAKALVLTSGRPGIFSAGFDLKVFAANDAERTTSLVRKGAELALRLLNFPIPTLGAMAGHAYPMGTFLLLACDVRIGARGPHRMGLNEVAIRIAPPGFAVELARSRMHPAWLSRTVTLGEMFEPDDAVHAGLLDRVVDPERLDAEVSAAARALAQVHQPSHAAAKRRLRAPCSAQMRRCIDEELTVAAYLARTIAL